MLGVEQTPDDEKLTSITKNWLQQLREKQLNAKQTQLDMSPRTPYNVDIISKIILKINLKIILTIILKINLKIISKIILKIILKNILKII